MWEKNSSIKFLFDLQMRNFEKWKLFRGWKVSVWIYSSNVNLGEICLLMILDEGKLDGKTFSKIKLILICFRFSNRRKSGKSN
jgi:hypothetical protein